MTSRFSKIQWGDGLTVTPDDADPTVIRVDSGGGSGTDGTDGVGVPAGGTDGQVLTKVSSTDFDTDWETPTGGGGGAPSGAAGGALDGSYPNPGLAASVAGAGLTEASDVLSVNVDGTTLVVASDQVKVNTDGNSGHYLSGAGTWTAPTATVAHLDDVGDVTAPTPADEQALCWDSGGSNWQPKSPVLKTIADAKGDLVAASGADAMARLAVGSNNQVLTADSAQTLGVKWATPAAAGMAASIYDPANISQQLVGTTATQTLTNKRVTKRVLATAGPGATPTVNSDSYDVVHLTALAAAITSMTTNLTGTPVDGDTLRVSFTDNGTARAITWGASFEASTVALPTTTVVSTRLDVGLFWNTETSKWRCVAVA